MSSHAVGYDKQARWIGSRYRAGDTLNCKQAVLVWTATAFDPGIQAGSYIQVIPCILPEPQARTQFVGRMAFKVIPCILPEPQARTQFVGRMAFKVIPCILPEPQARTQFVGRMAFKVIPCILPEPQTRTQFVGRMAFKVCLPLAPGLIRICEPFSKPRRSGACSAHNLSVCQGYIIQAGGF